MTIYYPYSTTTNASIYRRNNNKVKFSPKAWLKLQYFCHKAITEVAGYGISSETDLLYIEDFMTVLQQNTMATFEFDDESRAKFFADCINCGMSHERFNRIVIHTHPGVSAISSGVDDENFARMLDVHEMPWTIMLIVGQTGETSCRLGISTGPGAEIELPVEIDWKSYPSWLSQNQDALADWVKAWNTEFDENIKHKSYTTTLYNNTPYTYSPITPAKPYTTPSHSPLMDENYWERRDAWQDKDISSYGETGPIGFDEDYGYSPDEVKGLLEEGYTLEEIRMIEAHEFYIDDRHEPEFDKSYNVYVDTETGEITDTVSKRKRKRRKRRDRMRNRTDPGNQRIGYTCGVNNDNGSQHSPEGNNFPGTFD